MDVQLPDGRVVVDVPDDITKGQLVSKLLAGGVIDTQMAYDMVPRQGVGVYAEPKGQELAGKDLSQYPMLNVIQDPDSAAQLAGHLASKEAGRALGGVAAIGSLANAALGAEETNAGRTVEGLEQATTLPMTPGAERVAADISQATESIPQWVKDSAAWVGDKWTQGGDYLVDEGAKWSPELGAVNRAIVDTTPTAATMALGGRAVTAPARRAVKKFGKEVDDWLSKTAPDVDDLKIAADAAYKKIDDMGVVLNETAAARFLRLIEKKARKVGVDSPGESGITIDPNAYRILEKTRDIVKPGEVLALEDLNRIRKTAKDALGGKDHAKVGSFLHSIDEYLGSLKPGHAATANGDITKVRELYKYADDLHGRAMKSKTVQDALKNVDLQASGIENGTRIALRSIIKNKKQNRYFDESELAEMRKVVSGVPGANPAKWLGKFGFSENQATNIVGTAIGAGGGYATGGIPGMVLIPTIGQVSKNLAQQLTTGGAAFADDVLRAGRDGRKIVSAYLKRVPPNARKAEDLADLLVRPHVNIPTGKVSAFVREASERAEQLRARLSAAATGGLTEAATSQPEEPPQQSPVVQPPMR